MGQRAESRRGAVEGFVFEQAELDSDCLIMKVLPSVGLNNHVEAGKGYIQLFRVSA